MNINVTLKALEIQAPSSNPMPTFPLRSARPRPSNRPVRVTIPAPSITPTIPSTGLWDRSTGSAARPEDAEVGGGAVETVMDVALIVSATSWFVPLRPLIGRVATGISVVSHQAQF